MYQLGGVPEGTYNVRFSKAGYGDVRWFGMTVQGGGNAPIYWYNQQPWYNVVYPTLYKISDLATTLQAVSHLKIPIVPCGSSGPVTSHWLSGQYSGTQPGASHIIAVFFSHLSNVSSDPGKYEIMNNGGVMAHGTRLILLQGPSKYLLMQGTIGAMVLILGIQSILRFMVLRVGKQLTHIMTIMTLH